MNLDRWLVGCAAGTLLAGALTYVTWLAFDPPRFPLITISLIFGLSVPSLCAGWWERRA